jgi:hypothetical protein
VSTANVEQIGEGELGFPGGRAAQEKGHLPVGLLLAAGPGDLRLQFADLPVRFLQLRLQGELVLQGLLHAAGEERGHGPGLFKGLGLGLGLLLPELELGIVGLDPGEDPDPVGLEGLELSPQLESFASSGAARISSLVVDPERRVSRQGSGEGVGLRLTPAAATTALNWSPPRGWRTVG